MKRVQKEIFNSRPVGAFVVTTIGLLFGLLSASNVEGSGVETRDCDGKTSKYTVELQQSEIFYGRGATRQEAEKKVIIAAISAAVFSQYQCDWCPPNTRGERERCAQFIDPATLDLAAAAMDPADTWVDMDWDRLDAKVKKTWCRFYSGGPSSPKHYECKATVTFKTLPGAPMPSADAGCKVCPQGTSGCE